MSLLLDALKEAGTHRKSATKDAVEKLELSEDEFEFELDLNEQPGNSNYDNKLGEEFSPRDEIKDRDQHARVESSSIEGSKHNSSILQNEKAANAVFRNRTGNKYRSSKLVISASILLLLVVIVVAYFYWTLTNMDSVNQNTHIATRNSGTEMQMPMGGAEVESAAKNASFSASLQTEGEVTEIMLNESRKQGLDTLNENHPEISIDDNVGTVSKESDQMSGYQSNAGQKVIYESQKEQLSPTNSAYKNGGEITIRKRHMPNAIRKNLRIAQKAMVVGDWHKAESNFQTVLVGSPENIQALIGMADTLVVLGKEDVARSLYLNALEKKPGNVRASVGLLNLKIDKTSINHGSALKQLITENPDQAYLHANLGDYYALRGEWAAAQSAYFEAFSFNGISADYAFNLAVSLDQIGKGNIAIRYYKQALEMKKNTTGRFDEKSLVLRIRELSGGEL